MIKRYLLHVRTQRMLIDIHLGIDESTMNTESMRFPSLPNQFFISQPLD